MYFVCHPACNVCLFVCVYSTNTRHARFTSSVCYEYECLNCCVCVLPSPIFFFLSSSVQEARGPEKLNEARNPLFQRLVLVRFLRTADDGE